MASFAHLHLPRLLHPLLPFLILSILLPLISCDDNNDRKILKCESFTVVDEGFFFEAEIMLEEVKMTINSLMSSSGPGSQVHVNNIYGLAWCRSNIPPTLCSSCLNMASQSIQNNCAFNVVAARFLLSDLCYLRIDIKNFFGKSDTEFGKVWSNTAVEIGGVHKVAYWKSVSRLLLRMKQQMERETTKFVKMNSFFSLEKMKINGMAQCSRDLDTAVCNQCLDQAIIVMKIRCVYQTYCEVVYGSCFFTYRTKPIKN